MSTAKLFIDGEWVQGARTVLVEDKYTGSPITTVHIPSGEQVAQATRALAKEHARQKFPSYDRFEVLAKASMLMREQRDRFIESIVTDTGFTLADAAREVDRTIQTLLLCGEEAKRIHGEMIPLQGSPGSPERIAFTTRHPLGVVCAITPFNAPLNTVTHKVGPAIAAGNAVVLKPSAYTPLTACRLVELLLEAGLPPGYISLLHGDGGEVGEALLKDPIPQFYAFTGSTAVGEHIRRSIGLRRSQLELGSLSSTIVCEDADWDRCIQLCVNAAFRKAGQVCTSIQRLYVHRSIAGPFLASLKEKVSALRAGDPRDPDVAIGPVVSLKAAERIESWISAAVASGATLVTGGERANSVIAPTVLTDMRPDMTLMCNEVFGPVVLVCVFDDLNVAMEEINDTPYGLAAGIFTNNIPNALAAVSTLRMGSVHINETSSSRVDLLPYGGVKLSGLGREGPRYAIEEMTEERLVTIGGL